MLLPARCQQGSQVTSDIWKRLNTFSPQKWWSLKVGTLSLCTRYDKQAEKVSIFHEYCDQVCEIGSSNLQEVHHTSVVQTAILWELPDGAKQLSTLQLLIVNHFSCMFTHTNVILRENQMIVWYVGPYSMSWVPSSGTQDITHSYTDRSVTIVHNTWMATLTSPWLYITHGYTDQSLTVHNTWLHWPVCDYT